MCTAITLQNTQGAAFFGRTMDFSYPLDPELYVVPKGFQWTNLLRTHQIRNRYRYMGIGQNLSSVLFADGVNETGFAAAALYFPGYADYDSDKTDDGADTRFPIAATEITGFLLGLCASLDQATALLRTVRITGVADSITGTVAPLHWMIADTSGNSMVIEKTADGLHILDNPIGVLTNSPDFPWHLTNLRSYLNLSPTQTGSQDWGPVNLTPFGQGAGAWGLPGDYTPPSRFVRTAFQKTHASPTDKTPETVNAGFHILEGVSIPKGIVLTERGTVDYTQYTAFMNLSQPEYYFRTYDNSRTTAVKLPDENEQDTSIFSLGKLSSAGRDSGTLHSNDRP